MIQRDVYEYALLRVVPRVERGECFNAGRAGLLPCPVLRDGRTHLDEAKLLALDPAADVVGRAGRAARRRGRLRGR